MSPDRRKSGTIGRRGELDLLPTIAQNALAWSAQTDIPCRLRGVDPVGLQRAYRKAKGDWHRLDLAEDGALVVRNQPGPAWREAPS